ncbi:MULTISPECIES: thioredoxin family protein [Actinomadura]|uniref:Thioredoxin n=1 Tax=Actinomadura madurae TaxID=1993 RepID=A0A1I5JME5_9ACTN|nr:thioredoxin family protein [Actinomadura madurae]SFO73967.1 thioredoxin 1 [Actinomadura madurae]
MTPPPALTALSSTDFDQYLTAASQPLLVEFWASGCRPCQALMPILRDLAAEHTGRLRVATVKLDDAPDLARRYQIMTLPTLILFTAGRESTRITDLSSTAALATQLQAFLD